MPWGGLAGWEGQFGVPALVFIFLEVDLEETAVIQAGVAPVSALSAVLQLPDETVVDGVTTVGDVEEDVDLLHVLHEAAGDGGADWASGAGLTGSVDNSGVDICGGAGGGGADRRGGQGQQPRHLSQEGEEEQHVDHFKSQQRLTSRGDGRV